MLNNNHRIWINDEYDANLREAAKTMTEDEFKSFKNRALRVRTALSCIEDGDEELLVSWLFGRNTAPIGKDDTWIHRTGEMDLYYAKRYCNLFCISGAPGQDNSRYIDFGRITWQCTNNDGTKYKWPVGINFFEALIGKLYPIHLPYLPSKGALTVYFSQFSYGGEYPDTVAIHVVRKTNGKLDDIWRFFKVSDTPRSTKVEEIDKDEYLMRYEDRKEEV